jgi:hypothetical protein
MTSPDLRCYEKLDFEDVFESSTQFCSGYHTPISGLKQSGSHTPEFGIQTDESYDASVPPPKMPVAYGNAQKKRVLLPTDYAKTPVLFWNSSPTFDRCCQCDGYACISACACGRVNVCFECATGTYIERALFNTACYGCAGDFDAHFAQILDEPISLTEEEFESSQEYTKKAIYDFMKGMRPALLPPLSSRIQRMYNEINYA